LETFAIANFLYHQYFRKYSKKNLLNYQSSVHPHNIPAVMALCPVPKVLGKKLGILTQDFYRFSSANPTKIHAVSNLHKCTTGVQVLAA